jgi:hypothetical protein
MKKITFLSALLHFSLLAFSLNADSTKKLVSAAVTVTSNGISLVPAFTLDKPAAIFDLVVRKNKFSFEPEWAFGFDSKPWYFVFGFRYRLVQTSKLKMGVGFHPGFLFSTTDVTAGGVNNEYLTTSRFFVEELTPGFALSEKIIIGVYYQHSQGFNSILRQSHFVGLNCSFSNIDLGEKFFMKAMPEVYYLKNDNKDGFYTTSTFTFAKKDSPFFISSVINKKIQSNIAGHDFLWNLSLTYSL